MSFASLSGRVALVTGGGRGIGRGIAEALTAAGAAVAITYRRDSTAAEAVLASGGAHAAFATPTGEADELGEVSEAVAQRLGPVDLLVSNAGIASRGRSVVDTDADEVLRVMGSHAFAFHRWAQLVIPGMRDRGGGSIVLISSSELRRMRANGAPYNMAKAAAEALAFTLAHEEVRHRIRVNVVAPGLVATDMGDRLIQATVGAEKVSDLDQRQPLGRVSRPADIASAVCFLASDQAAMVTGQRLEVDAGMEDWAA